MNNKHIIQLDGLRFFAVLMVMVGHWLQWKWTIPLLKNIPFANGVTLFFVLSGFLITKILIVNKELYTLKGLEKWKLLKNFYVRRTFRIFPIYYLLIISLLVINYQQVREIFPWLITYTTNIYQVINKDQLGDLGHFWSLAVEEQFYLFWPILILLTRSNRMLLLIVLTVCVSLIFRIIVFLNGGYWMTISYTTIGCMQALALGALLAYLNLKKAKIYEVIGSSIMVYIVIIVYVLILFLQYSIQSDWIREVFDEFNFAIVSFFIIARAAQNKFKGLIGYILENKLIVYSGKISYGLYLYHLLVQTLLVFLLQKMGLSVHNKYAFFMLCFIITYLFATISWFLIEEPFNKLKDKVPYLKGYE